MWQYTRTATSGTRNMRNWRNARCQEGERWTYFFLKFVNATNCVWAHEMRHFDIIYIHKWNYGGCCCLHWQDVKNSWQTKMKVDRCATYLNLNMGLWTSGGPVSIINHQKKAFLWCLFVHLAPVVPLHVCLCRWYTCLWQHVCSCVTDKFYIYRWQWEHLTDLIHFALDCKTRCLCVHVCSISHSTYCRAAYWVKTQDWDERWKKKEYEM